MILCAAGDIHGAIGIDQFYAVHRRYSFERDSTGCTLLDLDLPGATLATVIDHAEVPSCGALS